MQAIIDNLSGRMVKSNDDQVIKHLEAIVPSKWPEDVDYPPWLEGELMVEGLCERFHVSTNNIIPSYREYYSDPRLVPKKVQKVLIQGMLNTIPISSSKDERGFSQMNLVYSYLRSRLTVENISSLLFIFINGPPPHLWNAERALNKWLLQHRSSNDNQSRSIKCQKVEDLNSVEKLFT